jgi:hypothetical protein
VIDYFVLSDDEQNVYRQVFGIPFIIKPVNVFLSMSLSLAAFGAALLKRV